MDTDREQCINVHTKDDTILKFVEIDSGLYMLQSPTNSKGKKVSGYSLLSLVAGNKAEFTEDEVMRADKAWKLHRSIGYPGYKKYFKLLRNEFFKDCPISEDDAKRALHIYRADKVMLQGKPF